ncbi:MAG: OmpA family protein [candidate division KSB1 bacterium]|nr:OmpA family protein [candidate division KSB1 bacterium]
MARRPKSEEGKGGAPEWVVTYGDMMSLLLTFFVLLQSFSSIQLSEFQKAMGSLKGALGVLKGQPSASPLYKMPSPDIYPLSEGGRESEMRELQEYLQAQGIEEEVTVRITEKGIAVTIESPILFDLGRADLKPQFLPLLDRIAVMATRAREIVIEGHADDLPINTPQFPSNWELSVARALSVLHYFETRGIAPGKMVAIGYGEYRPRVPNDSEENRKKNRRVEIFLNEMD